KQKKLIMLPSETMIWQPEFTDKTLSRKPGAVQCVLTALYDKSSSSQQWELHSTSASAYQHSNDGRPFMYFITYFTSNGGIPELYNAINTLAERWGYPLIDLP
ncbi:TPA: hypothetical protein ACGPXA_004686, partial [Escherichia coli]